MNPSLTPLCSFESLDPKDITSAIKTNKKQLSRNMVQVAPLGLGYTAFLEWAIQDIEAAADANHHQKARFSVSALMNARRSLSCLVDQYLARDCFALCRDAPSEAGKKADLLVRRGIFDSLASLALQRATARRNVIEHQYQQIGLDDAQDTVQLVRSTIENCVAKSDPYRATSFFGQFLGGFSSGPHGQVHQFDGWSGNLFVLARYESPPWFGIVIPSSNTEAIARRAPFSALTCDGLLEALVTLEARSSDSYSVGDEGTYRGQLACLGLRETLC
jgi:hypothetical protein